MFRVGPRGLETVALSVAAGPQSLNGYSTSSTRQSTRSVAAGPRSLNGYSDARLQDARLVVAAGPRSLNGYSEGDST